MALDMMGTSDKTEGVLVIGEQIPGTYLVSDVTEVLNNKVYYLYCPPPSRPTGPLITFLIFQWSTDSLDIRKRRPTTQTTLIPSVVVLRSSRETMYIILVPLVDCGRTRWWTLTPWSRSWCIMIIWRIPSLKRSPIMYSSPLFWSYL